MSSIRIGGMVSGFDTDQIVEDLMKVERTRVDKLEQSKQLSTWRQEAYNDLNRDFANFILDTKKEFGLTTTSSTGSLLNTSVSSLSWVKGVTSSNESVATVSATASTIDGSYDVKVKQLAANVTMASSSKFSNFDSSLGDTLAEQFTNINAGDKIHFTISNGADSVTIDNTSENLKIDDIVKQINDANIGITAVYDSSIDRFFLQSNNTGKDNEISIKNEADGNINFLSNLNLSATHYDYTNPDDTIGTKKTGAVALDGTVYKGADSVIDFAGANDINHSSNQFAVNGINFDLKSTGDFTIKVDTDVDAVYEKISSFVEKYNNLIDKVGKKLVEKQYRDFDPLTDEQKEAMSEKEIELWEEKAKSGLLRSDRTFQTTMQNMRNGLYESVEGVTGSYKNLYDIGITTEKYAAGTVGGKLEINEDDLKDAIRNDVDGVLDLLFKQADDGVVDEDQIKKESGLVTRLYDSMIDGMKEVINKAGPGDDSSLYRNVQSNMLLDFVTNYSSISILDEDVTNIDRKIDDMNDYLNSLEDSYWRKFSAMEKALNDMQAQSASLGSMMSGM